MSFIANRSVALALGVFALLSLWLPVSDATAAKRKGQVRSRTRPTTARRALAPRHAREIHAAIRRVLPAWERGRGRSAKVEIAKIDSLRTWSNQDGSTGFAARAVLASAKRGTELERAVAGKIAPEGHVSTTVIE